jgi:hypothetical protein
VSISKIKSQSNFVRKDTKKSDKISEVNIVSMYEIDKNSSMVLFVVYRFQMIFVILMPLHITVTSQYFNSIPQK